MTDRRTEEELAALRASCTRSLNRHGLRSAADMLGTISPNVETDRYGTGGVVSELEAEVASLLGKPAALLPPTGTMAQRATLRVHADQTGYEPSSFTRRVISIGTRGAAASGCTAWSASPPARSAHP